ncbi:MAG: cytochrome C [Campylobacterales bacterium]|nr:cytochrome C [Campylobacterales bacterium]NQY52507.1 cytochrome C [Campylobacteraceae bacterium]
MKKLILTACILAATALSANPFAKCVGCHGADGGKKALGKSKIIKNFTKSEIVAALNGYKDGSYGGVMKGLMKGQVASLSAADIKAIAEKIGK